MAADPLGQVITELRADAGVKAITANVWGAEIPDNLNPAVTAGADPRPYVLVKRLVPVRMKRAPVQTVRVAIQSIAKTPRLAAQLSGAVSDVLHMKGPRGYTSGKVGIYQTVEEVGGQPSEDPVTGWPFETAVYEVFATTGVGP